MNTPLTQDSGSESMQTLLEGAQDADSSIFLTRQPKRSPASPELARHSQFDIKATLTNEQLVSTFENTPEPKNSLFLNNSFQRSEYQNLTAQSFNLNYCEDNMVEELAGEDLSNGGAFRGAPIVNFLGQTENPFEAGAVIDRPQEGFGL